MSKSPPDLAMFHAEVSHLHALIVRRRGYVTVEGIERALAALLEDHQAKSDVVLVTSHPDFPQTQP